MRPEPVEGLPTLTDPRRATTRADKLADKLAVCGEKGVDRRGRRQTRASSAYADR